MKRKTILILVALAAVLVALSVSYATTSAQSGGAYDLTWNTFDGGGATFSTGGTYSLGGTIGQADAGTVSGGTYTLNGGFWVYLFGYRVMLPLIQR